MLVSLYRYMPTCLSYVADTTHFAGDFIDSLFFEAYPVFGSVEHNYDVAVDCEYGFYVKTAYFLGNFVCRALYIFLVSCCLVRCHLSCYLMLSATLFNLFSVGIIFLLKRYVD